MIDNEQQVLAYLNKFQEAKDRDLLLKEYDKTYDYDDTNINDPEYLQLINYYNLLLNKTKFSNYRVEVGPNCTFLIEKLFERYVTDKTFVLTTEQEHPAVKYCLKNDTYIIHVDELKRKDAISEIIKAYKQSGCINFFLIMQGVICGSAEIIDESFFSSLKKALKAENIPHLLVLDDCQGLYITDRDYSDFDAILGTAHVLVKQGFEMGILYTRLKNKIGYINKEGLKDFTDKLAFVLNHKKDALEFQDIIKKYLEDEIDGNTLKIKNNQAKHMLVVSSDGVKFNQKHADDLEKFKITFSELNTKSGFIRLRYQEAIMCEPKEYLVGLKKLKKAFRFLKRMKELRPNLTFDNSVALNYNYTVNGTNTKIGDVNSKSNYNSSFSTKEKQIIGQNNKQNKMVIFRYIFNQKQR